MFSWAVSCKRTLPPLHTLLPPPRPGKQSQGVAAYKAVAIFSYGTRDCRLHAAKWRNDPDALTEPYVARVKSYVAAASNLRGIGEITPIILACPPAVDYAAVKLDVETDGALGSRVQATEEMNRSLEHACSSQQVAFTGVDTWDSAKTESGSLRLELSSSGHTTIDPALCGPVQERLRQVILTVTSTSSSCSTHDACHAESCPAGEDKP